MSRPTGLPELGLKSTLSSAIWKATPTRSPYLRSASTISGLASESSAPEAQAAAKSAAVFPRTTRKYESWSPGKAPRSATSSICDAPRRLGEVVVADGNGTLRPFGRRHRGPPAPVRAFVDVVVVNQCRVVKE